MFVNIDKPCLYKIAVKKIDNIFANADIFKATDKKNSYIDVPVSIDIETTQTETIAFPWIYMFGINGICYATRYKDTFINLLKYLSDKSEELNTTLIIFIHNLNFEFTYFNGYFNNVFEKFKVFATDKNKALSVRLNNILILDSLRLTNMSLEKVAKNYKLKHNKACGQVDYNVYRNCITPIELSGTEKEYCANDVLILNDYWTVYKKIALTKKKLFRLIQTSTGITRQVIQSNVKNRKETQRLIWQYNDYTNEPVIKALIDRTYVGAFVKSNRNLTKKVLKNIAMWDYTSSYIGVLFEYKFPCGKFKEEKGITTTEIINNWFDKAYLFDIEFIDVKCKTGFSTISKHKVITCDNAILDNGRIMQCDRLIISFTDVDLIAFKRFYTYKKCRVLYCCTCEKRYMPMYVLKSAYQLFINKQILKHDKNRDEQMYLLEKGKLNALYGVAIEKEKLLQYIYDINTGLYNTEYKPKKQKGFMLRTYGIYITAYARTVNLLDTIADIEEYKPNSVVYTDTDSIKVVNADDRIYEIVNAKNKHYSALIKKCCDFVGLDKDLLEDIGMWDFEGVAEKIITNGSKKYAIYKDNKWHVTISGINKKQFIKYCNIQNISIEQAFFKEKFIVPKEFTNKLACNYTVLDDWLCEKDCNPTKGFVYLKPVDFTFKLDDKYSLLLDQLQKDENIEIMESDFI